MENMTLVLCCDGRYVLENKRNGGSPNLRNCSFYICIKVTDLGLSIPQQCYRFDQTWYYTPMWLLHNIECCNITD